MIKKIDAILFQATMRELTVDHVQVILGCDHIGALRVIQALKSNNKIVVKHDIKGNIKISAK